MKDNESLVLTSDHKHKIKGEKINEKFGVRARDFLDPLGPFPSLVKNEIKSEGQQHITETSDRFLNKNLTIDRLARYKTKLRIILKPPEYIPPKESPFTSPSGSQIAMGWLNEQDEKIDSGPDTPSSPESVAALVIDECTHCHIFLSFYS